MSETILEVEKLVKIYGSFRAVDGISFTVPKGKVVGFLGPNGAGKTTTIHMLLGITLTNGGSIRYFGKDFSRHRIDCLQRINFASAFNTLLGRISVHENLLVFANLYQVKHAREKILKLVQYFEIPDLLPALYYNLSAGQKTRVNLVKALLNDPELILMDEPTASLDPDIADKTLTLIEELKRERNLAILYTSHNMHEITRICDEVIFLDHGKIVAQDTPLNLTKRIPSTNIRFTFANNRDRLEQYLKEQITQFSFLDHQTVLITIQEKLVSQVLFEVSKTGVDITDIEIQKPTLEDVFLRIARNE
jgi:ABC-2 type transport system ATP-binding protein